jgi:hypothetical protein
METKIERDKDGWPVLKAGMLIRRNKSEYGLVVSNGLWFYLQAGKFLTASNGFTDAQHEAWCHEFAEEFSLGAGNWHPYTQEQPKLVAPERVWVNVYSKETCAHRSKDSAEKGADHRESLHHTAVEYVRADAVQGCIDYVREVAAGRWMSTDAARAAVATLPK